MKNARFFIAMVFCVLASIFFCAADASAMSDEAEIAVGRQVDARIRTRYGVVEDPGLQKYIEHIGLKIVNVSGRQNLVYHFTVLEGDSVNAMAAPGGYVYVTKGMLLRLNSEAELAAVISHQIIHIARRHGINKIEADMASVGKADMLSRGADTAYYFVKLGYGRRLETEADIKGAECLLKTGYDPEAMIKVLDVLQDEQKYNPGITIDILRAHPKTTKRVDAVRMMLTSLKAEYPDKYNSSQGNYNKERYAKNVLDVFGIKRQR